MRSDPCLNPPLLADCRGLWSDRHGVIERYPALAPEGRTFDPGDCTTTLFAALNVLDGTVIGKNMQRHRHQEFIRFLNAIEAQVVNDRGIGTLYFRAKGTPD